MFMKDTKLVLQSGEVFYGFSPEWQKSIYHGEVVFTTGMTGYVETLTDPSYADQMVIFTYPLIGNYGVTDPSTWESHKIHAAGVIISEHASFFSHSKAKYSFLEWLRKQEIPLITGIDTRTLTLKIRKKGVTPGVLCDLEVTPKEFIDPNIHDLVAKVSIKQPQVLGSGKKKIIVVDCGIKESILKHLLKFDVTLKRVPFDYDYTQESFDGLFISNGPGDPSNCIKTISHLQQALVRKKPVFGICLGAQLLALAIGAKTYKLTFGHRAQNQPVFYYTTEQCFLTSQNHGYAIDEHTLPKDWVVSFRHLNDHSVQGIAHKDSPFFAVQFHPEATPGPEDTQWLFENFIKLLDSSYEK
jgi:carbamoyl-phosphate synthase small subunit